MTARQRIYVWLVGIREGVQKIVFPQATKYVSERTMETSHISTQKFTVLRHKNWSLYCDSDYNKRDIIYCDQHVLHMSSLCGDQDDSWYVLCMTQNGEMCTVGISTCLSCEEAHVV